MFVGMGDERRRARAVAAALMVCAFCYTAGCKDEPEPGEGASAPKAERIVDVGFLVEACVGAGIGEEACKCVGEEAKRDLGAALVDKMRAAPADDDPALEGYYSGAEIRTVMAWVRTSSDACGIEDGR